MPTVIGVKLASIKDMKVVIIYGPPGVGKLTVAKRLAKMRGFKLFHVHLVADAILSLFPFDAKEFCPLMGKMQLVLLRAAAENRKITGVILTGVYSGKTDMGLSESLIKRLSDLPRARIFLVKLNCSERELYRRIKQPSRRAYKKPRQKGILKYLLKNYRLDAVMRFKKSLVIDNTKLSAERCARKIMRHYGL